MTGTVSSFVLMAVAGRAILTELNTFELMLYRSTIGFLIVVFFISRSKRGFAQLKTTLIKQQFLRNLVHYTGQNLWFFAIATIPLAQLIALEFTNPLWVALLAPFLLGETLSKEKLLIVMLGFVGVMIVARPGIDPITLGHIAGLAAAMGFAITNILTRRITRRDSVLCLMFWMTLMQAVFSLGLALPGGIPWPALSMWPWVLIMGVTGLSAHFCLSQALTLAPATTVAPMDFIRLPISALVGVLLYEEPLLATLFIGGGLILLANYLNLRQKS